VPILKFDSICKSLNIPPSRLFNLQGFANRGPEIRSRWVERKGAKEPSKWREGRGRGIAGSSRICGARLVVVTYGSLNLAAVVNFRNNCESVEFDYQRRCGAMQIEESHPYVRFRSLVFFFCFHRVVCAQLLCRNFVDRSNPNVVSRLPPR